jgi:hypothetical protein
MQIYEFDPEEAHNWFQIFNRNDGCVYTYQKREKVQNVEKCDAFIEWVEGCRPQFPESPIVRVNPLTILPEKIFVLLCKENWTEKGSSKGGWGSEHYVYLQLPRYEEQLTAVQHHSRPEFSIKPSRIWERGNDQPVDSVVRWALLRKSCFWGIYVATCLYRIKLSQAGIPAQRLPFSPHFSRRSAQSQARTAPESDSKCCGR